MKITAKAPGKLILLGEYAVLEGAPALVMGVDRFASVTVEDSGRQYSSVSSPTLNLTEIEFTVDEAGKIRFRTPQPVDIQEKLVFFTSTFEYIREPMFSDTPFPNLSFRLDTGEFFLGDSSQKLGLGSSAALTVALIAAMSAGQQGAGEASLNRERLFRLALQAHHLAQGKSGSGIDIAAGVFGGVLQFQKSSYPEPEIPMISILTMPEDLHIIPIWSGAPASTRQLVKKVNAFKNDSPSAFGKIMDTLFALSEAGCRAFADKNSSDFIEICNRYYSELRKLGEISNADIISERHRKIAKLVSRSGAAYKPSGAGSGDIGLALTDSPDTADKVRENILRSGFNIVKLAPCQQGVAIEA